MANQTNPIIKGGSFLIDDVSYEHIFTPEDYSDEHKLIAKTTEDFVINKVLPELEYIENHEFDRSVKLLKEAGELGLLAADIPEEYGGLGLDKISSALISEKLARAGVPILTRHTILEARGKDAVETAVIARLDENWQVIPDSKQELAVDVVCLAVGLSPVVDLVRQAGCATKYVPELGGDVPVRNKLLQTSLPWIYVAGDVAGVEEASAAMVEGRLAGAAAAVDLGAEDAAAKAIINSSLASLASLRNGPVGEKIRSGIARLEGGHANA